ncbi:MAG TPA: glycosyltransferase 87 family protein [Solirubrobacteraceae bacterium]|jgi:hypothetical protein|nr:glycosyltransferase 87 family protein [Solirubrobacteraceae bacterium]
MRRIARDNAPCALFALLGCATLAWLGLYGFAWNDYESEARPAFDALLQGHVEQFLRLAPAYGGSLVERAPFALLAAPFGGGQLAVYRLAALPCLLASAALGAWLLARMRAEARPPLVRGVALALCVANPITLLALEVGHPEELLGACLCIAAVLLAARERPLWAGLLLGLAIANKEWALLAAGPVLLALPARRRISCSLTALLAAGIVLAPLALVQSGGFVGATRASAAPASSIFQPWQLWWFFGHHGALVHGTFGEAKPGYRIGPAWSGEISHPLILAVGFLLSVALWLRARLAAGAKPPSLCVRLAADGKRDRRGAVLDERTALLAFALIMLLRCVLDTWDTAYYALPFLLALLAWELTGSRARPPLLTLACTALAWLSFHWLGEHASPDVQAGVFLAWTLPLAIALALRLFAPHRAPLGSRSPMPGAGAGVREAIAPQEMTVKPFSRPLSTS